jgi:hypothetical protein
VIATYLLCSLLTVSPPPTRDQAASVPAATPAGAIGAASARLVLVYHGVSTAVDRAVRPYLAAFAREYGPDGLAVFAAGVAADRLAGVQPLDGAAPDASAAPAPAVPADPPAASAGSRGAGAALVLRQPGGPSRLRLPPEALDLARVQRECEGLLRGGAPGYPAQARRLLEGHLVAGTSLLPGRDGQPADLAAILRPGRAPALFLPPGCGPCLLRKYEARLRSTVRRDPGRPALAFAPDALAGLRALGWEGPGHVLPLDAAARLLELRQAGVYLPLTVRRPAPAVLQVAPLPLAGEAR